MDCITSEIIDEVIESAYLSVNPLSSAEMKAIEMFSKIVENAHNATNATTASEIVNSYYCTNVVDEIIAQIVELSYNTCHQSSVEPLDVPERDKNINQNVVVVVECINKIDDNKAKELIPEESLNNYTVVELNRNEPDESIVVDSIEICKNEEDAPSSAIIPDELSNMETINEETEAEFEGQKTNIDGSVVVDITEICKKEEDTLSSEVFPDEPSSEEQVNEERELELERQKSVPVVEPINEERETDSDEQKVIIDGGVVVDSIEICKNGKDTPSSGVIRVEPFDKEHVSKERESDLVEQKAIIDERVVVDSIEIYKNEEDTPSSEIIYDEPFGAEQVNEERETVLVEQGSVIVKEPINEEREAELDRQKAITVEDRINEERENDSDEQKGIIDERVVVDSIEMSKNEQDTPSSQTIPDEQSGMEKVIEEPEAESDEQKEIIVEEPINKERETNSDGHKTIIDESFVVDSVEICKNKKHTPSLGIIPDEPSGKEQVNEERETDLDEQKLVVAEKQVTEKRETVLDDVQNSVITKSPAISSDSVREPSACNEFYSDDELHNRGYFMKFVGDVKQVTNLSLPSNTLNISKVLCRLPPDVTDNELIPILEKCGRILELRFVVSGVVIVTYMSEQESTNAVKILNGRIVRGSTIKVEKFIEKKQLYVTPIPVDTSKAEVFAYFDTLTRGLAQVYMLYDKVHPMSNRGYCYLTYRDYECAHEAMKIISNSLYNGRKMFTDYADRQLHSTNEAHTPRSLLTYRKIYMDNLRSGLSSSDLRKLFSVFGPVIEVDKNNNWASVKFRQPADMQRAFKGVDKKLLGKDARMSINDFREN